MQRANGWSGVETLDFLWYLMEEVFRFPRPGK